MKKLAFALYAWGSTVIMILIVLWLASLEEFQLNYDSKETFLKIGFRLTLYSIIFIFFYRSLLTTLKSSIERLSQWRSKRERIEDTEFVLIVETLLVVISILVSSIIAMIDKWIQNVTLHQPIDKNLEDLLISILGIILTAIIVYSLPVIGELEYAIKHWFQESMSQGRKR